MKKIFKSWKFIFSMTLLMLFLVFFIHQLKLQLLPPSKGWSRELLVKQITNQEAGDFGKVRVSVVPIPKENRFMIFWNEKSAIKYVSVTSGGKQSEVKSFDAKLDEPSVMQGALGNGNIVLYTLDSGKLNKIIFDYNSDKLISSTLLGSDVEAFFPYNSELLFCGANYLKFIGGNGESRLLGKTGGEIIDAEVKDSVYRIALMKNDESQISHLFYGVFNPLGNTFKMNELGNFIGSGDPNQSVDTIKINTEGNKLHVIIPMRNVKTNNTRTIEFTYKESNLKNPEITSLDAINGYNPNPIWIAGNTEERKLLASVIKIKGKNTETYNVREFILRNNNVIPGAYLTNTNDISINQNYFKLGNESYIVWENITGSSKDIMFASTDKNIQAAAGKMKPGEAEDVFLNSIMAMGFALSYLILIFSIVMMPTLILVVIASVFFMNWVEANPQKATIIAVMVHIFAELILVTRSILSNKLVLGFTPGFMHNRISLYVIVISLGLITYLCNRLKYRDNFIDKSFINQYAFFSILNMIMVSFLVFPYYYL